MSQGSVFERNLESLRTHRPRLFAMIKSVQDIPAFQLSNDGNQGQIQVSFNPGESQLYYQNGIEAETKDIIDRLNLKNPRILCFFGMGLGHHLLTYAQKPHPQNFSIVVMEAFPQVFKMALQAYDFTPLIQNPNVEWLIGQDLNQLEVELGRVFSKGGMLRFANAVEVIPLKSAWNFSEQFFKEAQIILQRAIGHQFNRQFGDAFDGFRGARNVFKNIESMVEAPRFDLARDIFKGKPGVLVASGPSLAKSLPFLKENQDKVVIVACPSSVELLYKNGVKPHIWVHLERVAEHKDIFKNVADETDAFMVVHPVVHPECLAAVKVPKIFVRPTVFGEWLPLEDEILKFGHSSAHMGFSVLQALGCDCIYLFGQDLSYSDTGSHAEGVWENSANQMEGMKERGERMFRVPGHSENTVELNTFWHTYLKSFEQEIIPSFSGKTLNVIPKDMGAKIYGASQMDPDDFSSSLNKTFDALSELRSVWSQENVKSNLAKVFEDKKENAKKFLRKVAEDSETFAIYAKDAQFDYDLATKNFPKAKQNYLNFLQKYDQFFSGFHKLEDDQRECYEHLLYPVLQGIFLKYLIEFYSTADDMRDDVTDMLKKIQIVFHMAEDQAFWARALVSELS